MSATSPLYGKTRDGLSAVLVGDHAFAMIPADTGYHLVKAWDLTRPIDDWTITNFSNARTDQVDEAGFRLVVEEWATHIGQLANLERRTIAARVSTPWGLSQHAVLYADGIVAHSTARHGGFSLTPDRNRLVHSALRAPDGFYEEDCAWVAVAIAYPDFFTDLEKRDADDILRNVYPGAWEDKHGKVLQPGQSQGRDRSCFDRDNADRWVVISASSLVIIQASSNASQRSGAGDQAGFGSRRTSSGVIWSTRHSTTSARLVLLSMRPAIVDMRVRRASSVGPRREMPRRSRKIARWFRTGDASRPSQRQAGDRWNRRLRTMLAKGRFVFRRSARVAAAVERILWRALDDGPAEPP